MIHMAQGAVDGVKNTLGIGSDKKWKERTEVWNIIFHFF